MNLPTTTVPSEHDKTAIVTGGHSGVGFVTALELARHGVHVILTCPNEAKGRDAVTKIQQQLQEAPEAGLVEFCLLDVSSLASVTAFSKAVGACHERLDILINNVSTMTPSYRETDDGYESMFATNYLGRFALTAQLIGLLKKSPHARIVTVNHHDHHGSKLDLNEIMTPQDKFVCHIVARKTTLYGLLFTLELNRRLHASGVTNVTAAACDAGSTSTVMMGLVRLRFVHRYQRLTPTVYAAIAPGVEANDCIGPAPWASVDGVPLTVFKSIKDASGLWEESERLARNEGLSPKEFRLLDVSSLASVAAFSRAFAASHSRLDILVCNAGIMAPSYKQTVDGYESMFATNYLGHFTLTAQLIGLLIESPHARVVTVSSREHRDAKMDLNEIMTPQHKFDCYAVSRSTKFYWLLITFELNRRLKAHAVSNVVAVACHQGMTSSNIAEVVMNLPIFQSVEMGALPSLYAATAPGVQPNDYFGPEAWNNSKGHPVKEEPRNVAKSLEHAKKLWDESERLAKVRFMI